jgi:hypothetical protein
VANRYKNAQFDLTTTNKTDIYTCPSDSRAIIQNIHTANIGVGNIEIKAFIYDALQQLVFSLQNILLIVVTQNL